MIQKSVQDPLAELILSGKIKDGEKVAISAGRQGITFNGQVGRRRRKPSGATRRAHGVPVHSRARSRAPRPSMSYVQFVLQPGERIILLGRLHWIVYWPAILFARARCRCWCRGQSAVGTDDVLISVTAIVFGVLFLVSFVLRLVYPLDHRDRGDRPAHHLQARLHQPAHRGDEHGQGRRRSMSTSRSSGGCSTTARSMSSELAAVRPTEPIGARRHRASASDRFAARAAQRDHREIA